MTQSLSDLLANAPLWYTAFLFSVVCHEAAHALVAKWGGDITAYAGGQVSLDPIPHIRREPFGLVVVPLFALFSLGWAIGWGSAPFDPYWQIKYPRRAALMALAGPVANFLIAILAASAIRIGLSMDVFSFGGALVVHAPNGSVFVDGLAHFLSILLVLNVVLGVFNLLPIPPLDGYTVLGLVLPEDITLKLIELSRSPGFSILGLLVAWKLFPRIAELVLPWAIHLLLVGV